MPKQDLSRLHEDIGYIKSKVEKIDSMDNRLMNVENKMSKMLGYATAMSAVLSLLAVYIKDKVARYI